MLIIITNKELQKFDADTFDDSEPPVLIKEAPFKFQLLAQNMQNYLCCGAISGDEVQFKASDIIYEEVTDIPSGYEQRVLPPQYGIFLNIQQINTGLMLENIALQKQRSDIDFLAIMTDIDLEV